MQHSQELSTAAIRPGRSRYNRPRRTSKDTELKPNKTKNFLPFFRNAHRDYLVLYWKKNKIGGMQDHPILARILFSKGNKVTLQDFETIYKMRELTACWISMFRERYLYRHLMLSRALIEQRHEYNQKMHIFEYAFIGRSFERIR